jgi:hypothetical protein
MVKRYTPSNSLENGLGMMKRSGMNLNEGILKN